MLQVLDIERVAAKDIKVLADNLSLGEVRSTIDFYYQVQESRKAAANQNLALTKAGEPASLVDWITDSTLRIEGTIKRVMDHWTAQDELSTWARSIVGIGPVISAGLRAHIDVTKAASVSHVWSFAGYNPTMVWEKGQKRPWNARLKVLCWKVGESFVKTSGNPKSFYGPIYIARKKLEIE